MRLILDFLKWRRYCRYYRLAKASGWLDRGERLFGRPEPPAKPQGFRAWRNSYLNPRWRESR